MKLRFLNLVGLCGLTLFAASAGCQSNPEILSQGASGTGDGDGDGDGDNGDGDGLSLGGTNGDGDGDGDGDTSVSPCGDVFCTQETSCQVVDGEGECVPNTCDELGCDESEECIENSLGAYCEDLSCDADVDCAAERYCDADDGICKDDVCTPGARSCSPDGESGAEGTTIYICNSNGGGFVTEVDCASNTSFASSCVESGVDFAGCGCEDDWDCPGFQECEAGLCQGSVEAPECRLAPADFADVLPSQELVWGTAPAGDDEGRLRILDGVDVPLDGTETGDPGEPDPAFLSPWHESTQVTVPPIVANLDDDNGDGLIDERDVPEILFLTFTQSNKANNDGTLRVIHGGGTDVEGNSKKGRDYFSVCGDNRFYRRPVEQPGGEFLVEGDYFDEDDTELGSEPSCGTSAELDPAATVAVGDLNFDGIPEIVAYGEEDNSDDFNTQRGRFSIFDNTGRRLFRSEMYTFQGTNSSGENPGVSLANVVPSANPDDDMVEIVIGRDLFTVAIDDVTGDWSVSGRYSGTGASGINDQGPKSCIADLLPGRPGMEIVSGVAIYGIPLNDSDELDTGESNLVPLGDNQTLQGFCSIADVWGADFGTRPGPANPLDQSPEIVVVRGGDLEVYGITIVDPPTPSDEWAIDLTKLIDLDFPGSAGGAPNIDDFDGDGFPEVGTAGDVAYVLLDFQEATGGGGACEEWTSTNPASNPARTPPAGDCASDADCNADADPATWIFACNETANVGNGSCVCLHNSWRNATEDDSSQVTGSSVFDFNGDGAAEVIYNDECQFRIYSGMDGEVLFNEPSESRTRTEYPIVADVDNDGNAEIVFATTTESGFCSENNDSVYNAGIEVWGDLSDRWVSARRVWNQYSYHVTNVNESGGIPRVEPDSWAPLGQRLYNTYRSQPRSFGSAPDLVVDALQVIAPGSCGASTDLTIGMEIRNAGDLRVSNVPVRLLGTWDDPGLTEELTDDEGNPIELVITQTLEPEGSVVFQVIYDKDDNDRGTFPDEVTVIVDPDDAGDGVARECQEDNNSATEPVDASPPLPDLRVVLQNPDDECPPDVLGTVFNDSNVAAVDVVVRIYAGDPATGASAIGDIPIGSVGAGDSVEFDSSDVDGFSDAFPVLAPILLYGEADPDDVIEECNEANNIFGPTGPTACQSIR